MSVKSPEMLLKLSKNPFYVMTEGEKQRLDDFLEKSSEDRLVNLVEQKSTRPEKITPATAEVEDEIIEATPKKKRVNKNRVAKVTGLIEEE